MFHRTTFSSSPHTTLSPQKALDLTNVYLENARKANEDPELALELCANAEASLSRVMKTALSRPPRSHHPQVDQALREKVASSSFELGQLQDHLGSTKKAQSSYRNAEKLGWHVQNQSQQIAQHSDTNSNNKNNNNSNLLPTIGQLPSTHDTTATATQGRDIATIPPHIFVENKRPPTTAIVFNLPEPDGRLNNTPQLARCLGLLQASLSPDDIQDSTIRSWLQVIEHDTDEQERLKSLATDIIKEFKRDELKDTKAVAELVILAPVLERDDFRHLLTLFFTGIDQSDILDIHQLEGLAQVIQSAFPSDLDADDLVKILELVSSRLKNTHHQSSHHIHQLTLTVSHVLDAMADTNVTGVDREKLHAPLSLYLDGLKKSSDSYVVYQAAYAYQALMCVPDNETLWQATLRHTGKVIQGVSGLVSAVKDLDLNGFIEGLGNIQRGSAGVSDVFGLVKDAYKGVSSLTKSGQDFMDCLKEGLSFERKRAWYSALRGTDALIREGQLAKFRKLVCEAPCRRDPPFQWGVCQRLGEIAVNPMWDTETRQSAIEFLGEIYRNDAVWGQQASVKQWILHILMKLASSSGSNKPDVEGSLRQLRKRRLNDRGNAVYIPPQAKPTLQAPDDALFPLMDKVKDFLASEQKVMLLLGDSGSGKSTFNRELEFDLWKSYSKKTGCIPLYISLPAIDRPERDLIAKQLRKVEFSESQIRELKAHRQFILICDGYDESQQTHNLYMSNHLNQQGEWSAKMVISCRTEYIGVDYRDRFRPGDRNHQQENTAFQEAVIAPFSIDQVQDYIKQYVFVHRPLWLVEDYLQALDLIPSLKDLVRNPFLLTLSLEVLPRMVDPGQHLSATQVTRVALYDQFVEQWLERGKKRLGEKEMSHQARSAFESLSDEGFALNGIDYLKKLAVAIYKEQGGHPVIEYSRSKDEGTWKAAFFSREDEKQLLRDACPLTRSSNQYRFIHRSLLEYGLARAVFDPQEGKKRTTPGPNMTRRGSTSSVWSFEVEGGMGEADIATTEQQQQQQHQPSDSSSPLVWRSFVNEPSVLQFLSERVQQESLFKQQLLAFIDHSKSDKQWRIAAANAITILAKAGVQFNGADLQGIQIPGADLSQGVFDSAQLQGADLRKVKLRNTWLRQANLSKAQMRGAQFGELPLLSDSGKVLCCAYAPNGMTFIIGRFSGRISVYTTSDWKDNWTSRNHILAVRSIAYSPNGDLVASGSNDKTVRLWDVETGTCQHTLSGHSDHVLSVVFSSEGHLIFSGSSDGTLRIWEAETGDCQHILSGHTKGITVIISSPQESQTASASVDNTSSLAAMMGQ
ncbi:hypothetical protein BGZ65_011211 [Modicella reniformis]|uniref:NACHT domain-containing protein n=1 Tax=Modicella reniformis TaxID=1440133 RepID=A0A9P6MK29_9FUNG|nr:hypothetical protein BGZ65_011211 [Modicella reniformis]